MTRNHHSPLPGPREQPFARSFELAREQLRQIEDIEGQCRKSGSRLEGTNDVVVNFLGQPYHISIPDAEIWLGGGKPDVPLKEKILILHYFTMARGTPPSGRLITYRQLPGGVSYLAAFSQRAVAPLVRHFGRNPELLIERGANLGGHEARYGDAAVTVRPFERVPIILVLWRGDDEVAPNGNVLFDGNISDYLPTEDVTVVSETIIWRLVRGVYCV